MEETRSKGVLVGALMLAAGLGYLYLAAGLPRRGAVDAAFVPTILAWGMIGLAALQLLGGLRRPSIAPPPPAAGAEPDAAPTGGPIGGPSYITVAKTLALVAGFVALMRPLGFPPAAALYLFLQFIVLTPPARPPRLGLYAALAVTCAVVIFVAFRYGFNLLLPAGPLTPYLP